METITRNTSNQSASQTTALSCDITSSNPLARVGGGIVGARNKVYLGGATNHERRNHKYRLCAPIIYYALQIW